MDDSMTAATIVDDDRAGFFNDGSDWKLLDSATDAYSIALATRNRFPPIRLRCRRTGTSNILALSLLARDWRSHEIWSRSGSRRCFSPKVIVDYAHRCGIQSPLLEILSIALGTEQARSRAHWSLLAAVR